MSAATPVSARERTPHDSPRAQAVAALAAARSAQPAWGALPVRRRLEVVRRLRRLLAGHGAELAASVTHPQRRSAAETLAAEILPLADACRFLERRAARILRLRRLGGWGPLWLGGSRVEERREPLGTVLIIGPGNYPLFLPGVQALQALVAGNAVLWKPGADGATAAGALSRLFARAGLPAHLLAVLPEPAAAARAAIAAGVDKVVFTGSAATGREVLGDLAKTLTPSAMELSGCDAVFVREDADVGLAAAALAFGLALNGGATCLAPRRVFVAASLAPALEEELLQRAGELPAVELPAAAAAKVSAVVRDALDRGARRLAGSAPREGRMRPLVLTGGTPDMELFGADLMAPVLALCPVAGDTEALEAAAGCPFALGAAIFSRDGARELAGRVNAGVVVINDLIAPTADPRVAFGGRADSGFGRTRGAAGLLEMTAGKTVLSRRTGVRPHLRPPAPEDGRVLIALLKILHGGAGRWLAGGRELVAAARRQEERKTTGGGVGGPERSAEEGAS